MLKNTAALILICLFCVPVTAQQLNVAKLDSFMATIVAHNKGMGSVAIARKGQVVYKKAIGYSYINDTGTNKPADVNTHYRIGSITKMFTATMIFQLIEEGKLTLKTPLSKFFPQFPNGKNITISMLLNHHSGLFNLTASPDYKTWQEKPKTQAEITNIIAKGKTSFKPGTSSEYSNSNFVLLGYIIEKIDKRSYSKSLKARVTTKAGLEDTYVGGKTDLNKNECYSYEFLGKWQQMPVTDMSIPGGAGAILSTPSDLVRFIDALFNGKLVSKTSLEHMKTMTDGYGMGMLQFPFGKKIALGHNGSIDGFMGDLGHFDDDSLTVCYITNGQLYPINSIMIGVLSICFDQPFTIPEFKTFAVKPEDLDQYTGVYSCPKFPRKITISKQNNSLTAQAEGQPSFPLEPVDQDKFRFDLGGIEMRFSPKTQNMFLKQGSAKMIFTKDNP